MRAVIDPAAQGKKTKKRERNMVQRDFTCALLSVSAFLNGVLLSQDAEEEMQLAI